MVRAELVHLGRARFVLEVDTEAGHELEGDVWIDRVKELADDFLRVPCHAHLCVGVAGFEQTEQLLAALLVEAFIGLGEKSATSVERVVLVAAVAEGLVLDAAAYLVELRVGELHEVERIGDLGGGREHRVEREAPRARQVQHRPPDRVEPRFGSPHQPFEEASGRAALDHVEELAPSHVHDRGRPRLGPPPSQPSEEHLVDTQRIHAAHPIDIGVQQCLAIGDHGVVDGVPVRTQLSSDIADRPAVAADLDRRPPTSTIGDRESCRRDPRVFMSPAALPAPRPRTPEPVPAPPQHDGPTEARQIHELDDGPVLDPRPLPTLPCADPGLDRDLESAHQRLNDLDDLDGGQTNQHLARSRSVQHSRGPSDSTTSDIAKFAGPPLRARDLTPRSIAKRPISPYCPFSFPNAELPRQHRTSCISKPGVSPSRESPPPARSGFQTKLEALHSLASQAAT